MSSEGGEHCFGVVYPRQISTQMWEIYEQAVSQCKWNFEKLAGEMGQMGSILTNITRKYELAEDARKVMQKRNLFLMEDNLVLQAKLQEMENAKALIEKEISYQSGTIERLETALKEILSESCMHADEKEQYFKNKRRTLFLRDRSTSCGDLIVKNQNSTDKAEEDEESNKTLYFNFRNVAASSSGGESNDPYSQNLKASGDFCKKPTKSQPNTALCRSSQRLWKSKHLKLAAELDRQKNMNAWKASEILAKNKELKAVNEELAEAKKNVLILKNKLNQNSLARMRLNAKRKIESGLSCSKKTVSPQPTSPQKPHQN